MATFTSRLGLEKPGSADNMRKGDSVLASNFRLVDKNMHVRYESDLANITAPYEGQFALDTDIDEVNFRNDTAWRFWGKPAVPRKLLAQDLTSEGTDNTPAGTPSKVDEVSVTIVSGRRYSITVNGNIFPSSAINYAPQLMIKTNTSATVVGDTNLFISDFFIGDGTISTAKSMTTSFIRHFTAATVGTGTIYFGLWLDTNAASANSTYRGFNSAQTNYSFMIIEDLGVA